MLSSDLHSLLSGGRGLRSGETGLSSRRCLAIRPTPRTLLLSDAPDICRPETRVRRPPPPSLRASVIVRRRMDSDDSRGWWVGCGTRSLDGHAFSNALNSNQPRLSHQLVGLQPLDCHRCVLGLRMVSVGRQTRVDVKPHRRIRRHGWHSSGALEVVWVPGHAEMDAKAELWDFLIGTGRSRRTARGGRRLALLSSDRDADSKSAASSMKWSRSYSGRL